MNRRVIVAGLVAFICLLASEVNGQQPRPSCGSRQYADDELRTFAKYFRDAEYAAVRKASIRQLGPEDPQAVVTNVGTCQAVLNAALRMFRRYEPTWPEVERHGYDFTVLRYGPYYAIFMKYSYDPNHPNGPPFLPLVIFRARGMEYVTTILN